MPIHACHFLLFNGAGIGETGVSSSAAVVAVSYIAAVLVGVTG